MFSLEEGIVACVSDAQSNMIIKLETGLYITPGDGVTWTAADSERRDAQWRLARAGQEVRDMAFVAAAREAVPELLDEVERLEDELRELRNVAAGLIQMNVPMSSNAALIERIDAAIGAP
jgi:hypothetical protein